MAKLGLLLCCAVAVAFILPEVSAGDASINPTVVSTNAVLSQLGLDLVALGADPTGVQELITTLTNILDPSVDNATSGILLLANPLVVIVLGLVLVVLLLVGVLGLPVGVLTAFGLGAVLDIAINLLNDLLSDDLQNTVKNLLAQVTSILGPGLKVGNVVGGVLRR